MKKLFKKFLRMFKKEKPVIIMEEPPTPQSASSINPPEEIIKDTVDDGSWESPDISFLFDNCTLDDSRIDEIKKECGKIYDLRKRFREAAEDCNKLMPWWLVGVLAYREDTSLNSRAVLHNGEMIVGTSRVTRLAPKGRGPFATWEEAAADALRLKNYHTFKDWSVYDCLDRAEKYNGIGYRRRGGEYSPYLWAGTNQHDETGKYVSDGKYSETAQEKQLGVAALIIGLRDFYGVLL